MALKKSDLYSSLWKSCDELRGGMDASQYKDYILTLLFMKYVSDKAKDSKHSMIDIPTGASFEDMAALNGDKEIGDKINKIIAKLAAANGLEKVIDLADFNDEEKLGKGKEMQDRLSNLVAIFADLDFQGSKAEGDDLLGDAYEYLMRHFATESGKSKGQFYTPAEVSRVMAKLLQIPPTAKHSTTVYDPTCGSGSLLIKVAAEAPNGLTIYGQEKDNATWALAEMNMILHGNEDRDIRKGDTITSPQLLSGTSLKTFDYAVANPPFSVKSWSNGLANEYGRFEFGRPPAKNGDYAFLLHILKSLKSTGKAAVILPHGVLFRGGAEAVIRKELVKRGYIKGIIGLPPNLFYGTGIPACIVVLDKENAQARTGIFMIDASKGLMKDGPKNRLRSQDMHKIVDVFNKQTEIERYSRMVLVSEIADAKNDYNLNIPRYIDSSEPEDLQDLHAHLHGGVPERDIDALRAYWDAFPSLRSTLFKPNRPGYVDLAVDVADVQQLVLDSDKFKKYATDVNAKVDDWFATHRPALAAIDANTQPNALIAVLGDDLLTRFKPEPLLDEYDVYEQLMTYWHDTMHDDVFMIMNDGWVEAATPRVTIVDKDRKLTEKPDLTIGSGKKATKYKMDLVPPALIVARYFADEQAKLDKLSAAAEDASQAVEEYVEEHAVEDGLLWSAIDDKDKVTQKSVNAALKEAKASGDGDTEKALTKALQLLKDEAAANKAVKEAQASVDVATLNKYGDLTEADVKTLILDDYQNVALTMADWSRVESKAEITVFTDHLSDPDAVVARLQPFDVVCVMRERTPLSRGVLERLPRLKMIASTGPGNASIDMQAVRERNIHLTDTGYRSTPTIELTWALILAAVRNLVGEASSLRAGGWQTSVGRELSGRVLGVLGLGRIGSEMARIGAVFGMDVIAWSQNLTPERAQTAGAEWVPREELFGRSDVLSIHLVLSERTRGLVKGADIAAMKPTAWLVNTSRGPIVDEEALIEALRSKSIAGAALDVFDIEPLPAGHSLRTLPNVLATPHIGYVAEDLYRTFYGDAAASIEKWLETAAR